MEERERDFCNKVNQQIKFPFELRKEFIAYWTEPNKSGTKMRFELEKTWDLSRRLHRWANTNFGNKTAQNSPQKITPKTEAKSTIKEVVELDHILEQYTKHPTSIDFYDLFKYYDFLKERKLLKPLTQQQINDIRDAYKGDNRKCRCACVQLTIQGYVDSGFTFSKVFELREKLNTNQR
jgi:hypothetical protein